MKKYSLLILDKKTQESFVIDDTELVSFIYLNDKLGVTVLYSADMFNLLTEFYEDTKDSDEVVVYIDGNKDNSFKTNFKMGKPVIVPNLTPKSVEPPILFIMNPA